MACPVAGVLAMALSKSFPTPKTQELFRVVIKVAVGAPEAALPLATAPTAPDPLAPDESTPVKLMTVIEEATLWDRAAVADTLLKGVGAKALHISEVPRCALVRTARNQVRPAPETLWTVVLLPLR